MKLIFAFGFSGGQLHAEVDNFEDADKVIEYALKRGALSVAAQTPAGDTVQAEVAAPVEEAPFENAVPLDKPPFDEPPEKVAVSVEDAQQAVKDYAAKHGIEKGRALLTKFGFKRTNEITAEKAADIVEACHE